MRLGISSKLFLTIFTTCILLLITVNLGVRISFERGFIDYIKRGNEQRLLMLSEALAEQYQRSGGWQFLNRSDQVVTRIMRSFDQHTDSLLALKPEESLPPHGWRVPFWILDQQQQILFGRGYPPQEVDRYAIKVNDIVVGWIIAMPSERLTQATDINFARQQQQTRWIIVILAILLAAAVTWVLSRSLLAPVKRLVDVTHRLAAGDFTTRVTVSGHDELGSLAQDFNHLAISLERNEQIRHSYMADISHELRTPLAVLRGELEALQDGVRQHTTSSLASLQAEVSTLTKLVDDLHLLSMSDLGALAYRKSTVEVVQLIRLAAAAFGTRFTHKGIKIVTRLPEYLYLFGDPDRLTQLFNNLLENSLRYTDVGGELEIGAEIHDYPVAAATLYFQDSAPGVDDAQLQRIFERFYRAEASRSRASGGSGLGLAICFNIVDAHGGQITAEHSPLGGVRMTMTFPLLSGQGLVT